MLGIHVMVYRYRMSLQSNVLLICVIILLFLICYNNRIFEKSEEVSSVKNFDFSVHKFHVISKRFHQNGRKGRHVISMPCEITVKHEPMTDKWQNLKGTSVYVFSAFIIDDKVRIVGIRKRNKSDYGDIYCQYWYKVGDDILRHGSSHLAQFIEIPEHHYKIYTASLFVCPITDGLFPQAVSLTVGKSECRIPDNLVQVTRWSPRKSNFTVCMKPIHSEYNNTHKLVEMLELNQILGADHFIFYVYNMTESISNILKLYERQHLVKVIRWNVPVTKTEEITTYGQLAAQNDCLYRNTGRTNYVVFLDIDEYIIPRREKTWKELLQCLPDVNGSYIFRCTFFRREWPDTNITFTENNEVIQYDLLSLRKYTREDYIFKPFQRSKLIVKPDFVDMVGIHFVHRFKNGGEHFVVDPAYARLNHYSLKSFQDPQTPKGVGQIDDFIMVKYRKELLTGVKNIWNKLSVSLNTV